MPPKFLLGSVDMIVLQWLVNMNGLCLQEHKVIAMGQKFGTGMAHFAYVVNLTHMV